MSSRRSHSIVVSAISTARPCSPLAEARRPRRSSTWAAAAKWIAPGSRSIPLRADRRLGLVELPGQQLDLGPEPITIGTAIWLRSCATSSPSSTSAMPPTWIAEVRVQGAHLGAGDRLRDHEPGGLGEIGCTRASWSRARPDVPAIDGRRGTR